MYFSYPPTSPLPPDEVDALLSRRGESEHDAMRRLKNEFLSSFDGVHTSQGERILVMAATNRPHEIDDTALGPIRELDYKTLKDMPANKVRPLELQEFHSSIKQIRPSVSRDLIHTLEQWNAHYRVSS